MLFSFLIIYFRVKLDKKRKKTHKICRLIVCAACGKKDFKCREVKNDIEKLIKDIHPEYNSSISVYPAGVCSSCLPRLYKGKQQHNEKDMQSWSDHHWKTCRLSQLKYGDRASPENYNCSVCNIARSISVSDNSTANKENLPPATLRCGKCTQVIGILQDSGQYL